MRSMRLFEVTSMSSKMILQTLILENFRYQNMKNFDQLKLHLKES